ncbi:MAG: hypothetical protein PHI98_09790 [Eubacteriales bacterium]|nr:hypothetical protein [Eubacteriales bacterium]
MRISKRAREAGLVAAILVILSLCYTLFAQPGIGAVIDDSYGTVMSELKLAYPEGETGIGHKVEQYRFLPFDYASLLTPGKGVTVYAAALCRLVTEPFGLLFSTRVLAFVYMLMIALGAYLMVSGLYGHSRLAAGMACVAICVLMMENNITGYLNSLYSIGGIIAGFMLFVGCVVHTLCLPRGTAGWQAAGVILSASILLCTQAQLIILVPCLGISAGLCVWWHWPKGRRWANHLALCGLALLFAAVGVSENLQSDASVQSDSANYLAIFQGYLNAAENPEETLTYFGLDDSYLADKGRSYYDPEEAFVHNPRNEAEQDALLQKIGLGKRIAYCVSYPDLISRALEQFTTHLYDPMNERIQTQDGNNRFIRPSPIVLIGLIFSQEGFGRQSGRMLAAVAIFLLLAFIDKKGMRLLAISLCTLNMGFLFYLPACIVLTGGVDIDYVKVVFFLLGWISFFLATGGALRGVQVISMRLEETGHSASLEPSVIPASETANKLAGWAERFAFSRKQLLWVSGVACLCIGCMLLLPQKHIGSVNNGDFGRMMNRLDIFWTQEYLDRSEEQLAYRVIEKYDYLDTFHPERLTSLEPTYSLVFPAAVMRLVSGVTGMPFDTRIIAAVLMVLVTLSILLILHDLYPLMGRATALAAVGLISMLLGECYVAWYNSLFGEGSIIAGLIMTVATALHLCLMERGSKRSILWFVALGFSLRFLVCSKAQMALALPVGIVLFIALGIYHYPKGLIRCVSFLLVTTLTAGMAIWDGYNVYKDNAGVSENVTLWQSVFYGALMVADDPITAMEELGIDTAMAPDIGKDAYHPDSDYVYSPSSQKAQEVFYSKVSTVGMVLYYLRHPKDLLTMLDRAAQESVNLHTGFMTYTDELYGDVNHNEPYRFNLWKDVRSLFACRSFWQYVLLYGAVVAYCVYRLTRKKVALQEKLLIILYLAILCIGIFQFPLTVIGNGMADNNKQEAGFMLCHDLLVLTAAMVGVWRLQRYTHGEEKRIKQQGSGIAA